MSRRYCKPWATLIPPATAYGESRTKTGSEKSSEVR
jgi:hypothetical protein